MGFICEGDTERKIIESSAFQQFLIRNGIRCVGPVEDAKGNGNLLPHTIEEKRNKLFSAGASLIVILTDLDKDACITKTKQRIQDFSNQVVVVAVKEIEAWFLADSDVLTDLIGAPVYFDHPEKEEQPFETIKQIFLNKTGRGVGTKPMLARRMLKYGFSIEAAAKHPNCPSARYFLTKLQTLASAN
ncbi:hypothetical protein [Spirosoma montaniterrae]|uniref:DUF4276 family protein n=1 Tax=Spirosoma montaniterrae TaxID=1178516 RepID=A0A1P9WUI2_9BACT|nr:hypothetical protein [Spirosoma montaniterrae]AQG79037.1 hypothetical protein AWR27_06685 [Spirosoma montaniterrae]